MKKYLLLCFIAIIITGVSITLAFSGKRKPPTQQVHEHVSTQVAQLRQWYTTSWQPAVQSGKQDQMQMAFLEGRRIYKRMEWAIAYFFPTTAKDLNGAPLPEIEVEEHTVFEPSGFQVIEELIYPFEPEAKAQLLQETNRLGSLLYRLEGLWKEVAIRDDQVWAAMRLDLVRMAALSLSGFDTPLSGSSISEMRESLQAIEYVTKWYTSAIPGHVSDSLQSLFRQSYATIHLKRNFPLFDRHAFLRNNLLPLSASLLRMQHQLQIPVQNIHAIDLSKPSFFDANAFQVDFFTPDASSAVTAQKIALGKILFADRVLSKNGTVSCMSCHLPEKAFTDGMALSRSFGAGQFLSRNTPSVLYAGLQQSQFYDMRAGFLEDQVRNVVENRDEIHGSLDEAAVKMNQVPAYRSQFREAMHTDSITAWDIQVALAAYVRSLAPFSSRFDQHMRGKDELSPDEISGFNLFMGKAKCGTCHFMPVFNGTIPPFYTATESEVIGVPYDKNFSGLSRDSGRYTIYKIPALQFAFKTPTLRNIALTAPYMHNGIFETLEEVVDFYDRGGGVGRGLKLDHQTLPETPLQLTEVEKKQLILFLKTLTDNRY